MPEKKDIRSESRFVFDLLINLLKWPITIVMVILGKEEPKELFKPFIEIFKFLVEAKFTIVMIVLNILIYFFSMYKGEAWIDPLMSRPSDLIQLKLYTIITSGFLHANLSHLLGNMLALFIFGRVVERKLGAGKTALTYFGALIISGIFTSVINLVLGDNSPGLGASGAIMGMIAAAILLNPLYISYEALIPMPVMVLGWIAIWADITGILNPTEDGIGHFAHLGGFISVALIMFILGVEERKKMLKGLLINIICLVLAVLMYFLVLKGKMPI